MESKLINAIRVNNPEIMSLFAPPFETSAKWKEYADQHLNAKSGPSIDHILNKTDRWHSIRFQALYIACWIYHPIEKGSYMIRLSPEQKKNAVASAGKLTWRKSSHLKNTSHSARGGTDFKFIKGYGELLVIVEGDYLFLKMEGHKATSPSHFSSWVEKKYTGSGLTANHHLNALSLDSSWGITQRGAENYGNGYKSLLKELKLSGKSVSFSQLVDALNKKYPNITMPVGDNVTALRAYFKKYYCFAEANNLVRRSTLYRPLMDARKDIDGILNDLEKDNLRMPSHDGKDHLGVDRIFREIRVSPQNINSALESFYAGILSHSALGVLNVSRDFV